MASQISRTQLNIHNRWPWPKTNLTFCVDTSSGIAPPSSPHENSKIASPSKNLPNPLISSRPFCWFKYMCVTTTPENLRNPQNPPPPASRRHHKQHRQRPLKPSFNYQITIACVRACKPHVCHKLLTCFWMLLARWQSRLPLSLSLSGPGKFARWPLGRTKDVEVARCLISFSDSINFYLGIFFSWRKCDSPCSSSRTPQRFFTGWFRFFFVRVIPGKIAKLAKSC